MKMVFPALIVTERTYNRKMYLVSLKQMISVERQNTKL